MCCDWKYFQLKKWAEQVFFLFKLNFTLLVPKIEQEKKENSFVSIKELTSKYAISCCLVFGSTIPFWLNERKKKDGYRISIVSQFQWYSNSTWIKTFLFLCNTHDEDNNQFRTILCFCFFDFFWKCRRRLSSRVQGEVWVVGGHRRKRRRPEKGRRTSRRSV